jgi:hypothetical protein
MTQPVAVPTKHQLALQQPHPSSSAGPMQHAKLWLQLAVPAVWWCGAAAAAAGTPGVLVPTGQPEQQSR